MLFSAGHDDDEATVSVRMRSGVNIGTSTLGYKSDVTIDVTQIYLRLLDSACSHVTSVDRSQLDAMLSAAIFQDDAQIPAKAFEVLFDSVSSLVAGISRPSDVRQVLPEPYITIYGYIRLWDLGLASRDRAGTSL